MEERIWHTHIQRQDNKKNFNMKKRNNNEEALTRLPQTWSHLTLARNILNVKSWIDKWGKELNPIRWVYLISLRVPIIC